MKVIKYMLNLVPVPEPYIISDFLTSYGSDSGSGSTSQKVTVPTVPVPVPQHCFIGNAVYRYRDPVEQFL